MGCIHFPDMPDEISNCGLCKPPPIQTKQQPTAAAPGVFRRHATAASRSTGKSVEWVHEDCRLVDEATPVEAQYPSHCYLCGDRIKVGDMIVADDG